MKKYTIVYADVFQRGSHQVSITKLEYIECTPSELNAVVEEKLGWGNVWFVLDGHCKQTED